MNITQVKKVLFTLLAAAVVAVAPTAQAAVFSGEAIGEQALSEEVLAEPGLGEEALAQLVYERIAAVWGMPTASLTIAVEDGLVELSGEAPDLEAAALAERVADETPAVVWVINRLEVR